MDEVRCPACGGGAVRLLAPGYYECGTTVMVPTGRPPSGAAGPPLVPQACGNTFQVGGASVTPPCHRCGVYSIGACQTCSQPTCGHCSRHDGRFTCLGCIAAKQARVQADRAQRVASEASRREVLRTTLADLLTRWIAAPAIAPRPILHAIDTGAKGPVDCPLGHRGCTREKVRTTRGYGGHTTNYYVTRGWAVADLVDSQPSHYLWPPEGAGRWERQFPYRGHEQISVHGDLLGAFSVAAKTTGMEDRFYRKAQESEGSIDGLRRGLEPACFARSRSGGDLLPVLVTALQRHLQA